MPTLIEYIRKLQDAEYARSANAMLSAIGQMSKGQGSEIQALIVALERKAKEVTEAGKLVSSEVYSQMLAEFRGDMNKVERLIRQTAPDIELSGARVANNSVTSRLFYGTSQDMIEAGIDPTSAEAMAYFMQLVKDVGIPWEVPQPEDLVSKYTESQEFFDHMDKWGDGYADYFDESIKRGISEGWGPAKTARYARGMAENIPLNAAYTWTRTLQLQSYRDASARMELLNGRFIEKKIRISALDGRTCFPAGTKIKTPLGYKNIEDIKVGDNVISHKGIERTVTGTMERDYVGGMSKIKAGNKELYCTEDHSVLISRGGHDYWEVAKNIVPGDKVFIFSNKGTDNLNHVSGDLPVKWGIWNTNNKISFPVQSFDFSGISGRSLSMPINTVNLESNVSLWKEKINGISIYFRFLLKQFIKFFKANSNVSFWFCLASILMIAGRATKLSTFVNFVRTYSKFFSTISASQILRRSSTFFRAIMPVFSSFYIKHFSAPFTSNIFSSKVFIFTFYGAIVISISIGLWNTKFSTTTNTDFMSASSGKFTFFRAINELSSFFNFTRAKVKFFATDDTGKVFPIALLPFGITSLRTTHIAGLRPDLGHKNFKLFSAKPTSFNNSFTTHIVTSSNISNLNYNIKVYNLEVENDESYIANDIVVHNCPACIALHGTELKKGEPVKDHYNGRCDAIYVPAGGEMPEFMQSMSTPGNRQFVEWQNGTDWFDAQSDSYQRQVLGAGIYDLYKQGKFRLDADFVKWHDDDVFGSMPGPKPLKDIKD